LRKLTIIFLLAAYAYINGYISVYFDACQYPDWVMHEIGHNLGLTHANQGDEYSDDAQYQDYR